MNVNEVISQPQLPACRHTPLGSKAPVHPNDHVNMSQSSNDSFVNVKQRLIPAVKALHDAITDAVHLLERYRDKVLRL